MKIVTDLSLTSRSQRARNRWDPGWLFHGGAEGAWYDPSDLTTLWQDAAGTVPVIGAGQPVGRMADKSGNGHHATQAVSAARPILRTDSAGKWYLEFDGVDDRLSAALDLTACTKLSVFGAVRKLDSGVARVWLGHTGSSGNAGGFDMGTATGANAFTSILARSTAGSTGQGGFIKHMIPPVTFQITGKVDYAAAAGSEFTMRVDGSTDGQFAQGPTQENTGTFGAGPLTIGCRANNTLFHNGWVYGACLVAGTLVDGADLDGAENYFARMIGGL